MINLNSYSSHSLNSCLEDTTGYTIEQISPLATSKADIIEVINGMNEEYKNDFYANLEDYQEAQQ